MYYNIMVDDEAQTICSSAKIAEHIVEIYKRENTFPNKRIEIVEDPIKERVSENDLLSQLLKESEINFA